MGLIGLRLQYKQSIRPDPYISICGMNWLHRHNVRYSVAEKEVSKQYGSLASYPEYIQKLRNLKAKKNVRK